MYHPVECLPHRCAMAEECLAEIAYSISKMLELGCLAFIPKRSRNSSSTAVYLPCCRRKFYLVFAKRLYTTSGIFLAAHMEGMVYSLIQIRVDNTTAYYIRKIVMYLWSYTAVKQCRSKHTARGKIQPSWRHWRILLSRICLTKRILYE